MDVAREDGAAVPALRDAPLVGVALPAREDDVEDVEAEREVEAEDLDVGAAERVVVAEPLVRTLLVIVCGVAVVAREVEAEVLLAVVDLVLVEGVAVVAREVEAEVLLAVVDLVLVEVVFVPVDVVAVVARDVVAGAVDLAVEEDLAAVALRLTGVEVVVTVACCWLRISLAFALREAVVVGAAVVLRVPASSERDIPEVRCTKSCSGC